MSKSNYLENKLVAHTLANTSYTSPSTVYVSIHTAAPSEDGATSNEATDTNYVRKACTFSVSNDTATGSNSEMDFFNNGGVGANGAQGNVTHFGIYDAATSGNLLYYGALASTKNIQAGDILRIPTNGITVTEA